MPAAVSTASNQQMVLLANVSFGTRAYSNFQLGRSPKKLATDYCTFMNSTWYATSHDLRVLHYCTAKTCITKKDTGVGAKCAVELWRHVRAQFIGEQVVHIAEDISLLVVELLRYASAQCTASLACITTHPQRKTWCGISRRHVRTPFVG